MILSKLRKAFYWIQLGKYHFGALTSCKYPYKIGGIQVKNTNPGHVSALKQIFGPDLFYQFKQAYVTILQALKDKDKQFLKQVMQMTLVNNIQFPDVELINQNSEIAIQSDKPRIIFGGQFVRTNQNREVICLKANNGNVEDEIFFNRNFFKSRPINTPVLLHCDIYFKGKTKLVKKNAENDAKKVQTHMIQYQLQNYLDQNKGQQLLKDLRMLDDRDQFGMNKILKSLFIGKDYKWRIGDIDKVLQGNFKIKETKFV